MRGKLRIMFSKAFIAGCTGLELSPEEISFYKDEKPWGFIIFARNIESREQVLRLTDQMRECVGRGNAPVLIDEEGGRVQRLRPPEWVSNPAGRRLGQVYEKNDADGKRAAWLLSRLIAHDLVEIGVNVDCLPILDVPIEGVHDAIGDRAYSQNPDIVADIGASVIDGLLAGGVLPIVKHMPGHGRAISDSHFDLPKVCEPLDILLETDFKPFKALSHAKMAMTAHIVFEAIDCELPATTSARMIDDVIRGKIGFDGFLMSDDISMSALSGDYSQRTKSSFAAGCDLVLHCNGIMEEMVEVAAAAPELTGKALERADAALSELCTPGSENIIEFRAEFNRLIAQY